jgi:Cdc6-like AAA superfamily ATPase
VTAFVEGVEQDRSTTAILAVLKRLIEFIADLELRPIFLIDDSDAWLNIAGVVDRTNLISAFFGRVLRMLAELPAGLVVAVHASYLERDGFREQVEGFLERSVHIPALATPPVLATVLLHRLRTLDDGIAASDVFEDAAISELHGYYLDAASASLRRALQVAQRAVQLAAEAGLEVVSPEVVEAAVSDWV